MNPRIAFAFARGARVQYLHQLTWVGANFVSSATQDNCDWRIHPSDEHLQYGLLSSMLRNSAKDHPIREFDLLCGVVKFDLYFSSNMVPLIDQYHWRMYELFMAEALADEGL